MRTVSLKVVRQINRHKRIIGEHRDALRTILDDLEAVVESTDEAYRQLENAIETLSQYL